MTTTSFNASSPEHAASGAVGSPAAPVATRKPNPSKVRMAALMVVAVYPIITLYLYLLMPLTDGWALWQRTLVLVPLMVGSIVFVVCADDPEAFRLVCRPHAAADTDTAAGIVACVRSCLRQTDGAYCAAGRTMAHPVSPARAQDPTRTCPRSPASASRPPRPGSSTRTAPTCCSSRSTRALSSRAS